VHSTSTSRPESCELGYSENLLLQGDFQLTEHKSALPAAEISAVTAPTVVSGLGYPADRIETSPEPTGWNVSRETFTQIVSK
jgi:hypothetical protein